MAQRSNKPLLLILLLAFAARVGTVAFYADFDNDYYWEHGEITYNLLAGKGYSYFVVNDLRPQPRLPDADPAPSAYVPPGYSFYLAPFLLIESGPLRNGLLLLSHVLLSAAAVWLLYRLASRLFNERIALLAAAIAALVPEFLYASLSFTPTVLYHFFILLLFLRLEKLGEGNERVWDIGLLIAVLIYFRSEFVLFAFFFLLLLFVRKEYRAGLVIGIVTAALLLPWAIRNYVVFDTIVPMTTSFGLNLYRGHNPYEIGAWGDEELAAELLGLDRDRFEIEMSRIYRERAVSYMRENPEKEATNSLLKLVRFWSFDPSYEPSTHPLYYVPNMVLFLLWAVGLTLSSSWRRYRYHYLFFLSSIVIVVAFFPLPRYQTMMKILALPFAAYAAMRLYEIVRRRGRRERAIGVEEGMK